MLKNAAKSLRLGVHVTAPFLIVFVGLRVIAPALVSYPSMLAVALGVTVCWAAIAAAVIYFAFVTRPAILEVAAMFRA